MGDRRRAIIAPSILSGNFARLARDAAELEAQGADWLHVDVMDGHFVPNLTIGPCVVSSLRQETKMFLDCHLMVSDPLTYGPQFAKAGANLVTFHVEATEQPGELAKVLRDCGVKVGVSVKPNTPIEEILDLAESIDLVLIMTVEPGFGGQSFMANMMKKVERASRELPESVDIEVDGGLNVETVKLAAEAGANVIVAGSAVFRSQDRAATIAALRDPVERALSASLSGPN